MDAGKQEKLVAKGKQVQKMMIDLDIDQPAVVQLLAERNITVTKSAVSRALSGGRERLLNVIYEVVRDYKHGAK